MRDFNYLFLVGFVFLFCVDYIVVSCHQMRFQAVEDGASITGLQPYLKHTMSSKSKCYMLCQRKPGKCCFIELAKQEDDVWMCSLYDFVGDLHKHLTPSPGSLISAPKANPQMDCLDWRRLGYTKDGVYYINFNGYRRKVYCDMTTEGGGWIVMQKRFDGSLDFNRDWASYREGFGDVYSEHWLGNEFVHQYTQHFQSELIAEATGFDGQRASIQYGKFSLRPETSKYEMQGLDCQGSDTLCTPWQDMTMKSFSTLDEDNDKAGNMHCADYYRSGWWFGACTPVNFNAPYSHVEQLQELNQGITWDVFRGQYAALKSTAMKIRRKTKLL